MLNGGRVLNICFHGVGSPGRPLEAGEAEYWIDESLLASVLDRVRGRPDIALSFDDGNASDVAIALPMLRDRHLRATFFPLAGRLGEPGSVDRAGLRELVAAGMTVGSHGMNHVQWRDVDDRQLDEELRAARDVLSDECGVAVSQAACPLGSYDRRVLGRLRKLGYTRVFTSDRATARGLAWLQPRFSIRAHDTAPGVTMQPAAASPAALARATRTRLKRWR